MHNKLLRKCLRLDCDIYGNPRYYVGTVSLAVILGISFAQLKANREHLKLTVYKGRKYGFGFVLQSYNLEEDLSYIKERLAKILILQEKFPDFPIRIKCGRIEQKIVNRWKPYDDQVNNYFNNLDLTLNVE